MGARVPVALRRAEWLKPYTADVLETLGKEGTARVDVVCPGFVSDCLETLEEIAIEVAKTFRKAGGSEFHVIPCLNEHPRGSRRWPSSRSATSGDGSRRRRISMRASSRRPARRRWARPSSMS